MGCGFGKNHGTAQGTEPLAQTRCGKVRGENRNGIAVFRGIPYGGPCGGKERFCPPSPAKPWEGIRDCQRNGPCAPQFGCSISGDERLGSYFSGGQPERFGCREERQSENCLVLNVVTPGCDEGLRPVVVYIHGGGFATGSGTLVLGADGWARQEDLVIVGVNHRLNVFGYLYLGELSVRYRDSGIAGMLDLIQALKWVKENIRAFGGNPEKVTLMGESGGGVKVSALMAMPEARGLFQRAIVESGSMEIGMKTMEEGTRQARAVLKALDIPEDHLELLEKRSAEELLRAVKQAGYTDAMDFLPVADGLRLPRQIGYSAPAGAEHTALLVGSSEDELAVFLPQERIRSVTWANLPDKLGEEAYWLDREERKNMAEAFRLLNPGITDPGRLYVRLCSKLSFLAYGAYCQAREKAAQEALVFHYVISWDTGLPFAPQEKYAWHTADLPLQMGIVLFEESKPLSHFFTRAWGAFIRTGNPSYGGLTWLPFTEEGRKTMVIDSAAPHMEQDPWREERELLEPYLRKKRSKE